MTFRGRELSFAGVLLFLDVPGAALIVPVFHITGELGLFNNHIGVALPEAALTIPIGVRLLRDYGGIAFAITDSWLPDEREPSRYDADSIAYIDGKHEAPEKEQLSEAVGNVLVYGRFDRSSMMDAGSWRFSGHPAVTDADDPQAAVSSFNREGIDVVSRLRAALQATQHGRTSVSWGGTSTLNSERVSVHTPESGICSPS